MRYVFILIAAFVRCFGSFLRCLRRLFVFFLFRLGRVSETVPEGSAYGGSGSVEASVRRQPVSGTTGGISLVDSFFQHNAEQHVEVPAVRTNRLEHSF
jgi:hypothetical protein